MNLAANQYKIQVQNNNWRTMSEQDQKILALESKLDKYEKSFNSLKGLSSKKTPTGKSGSPPNHQKSGNSKQTNNGKGKSKPFDFPTWMTIHPGQDFITAGKPKIVTGKSYWWCKNHKRFVDAALHHKLFLINRASQSVWRYRCPRWAPSKDLLKSELTICFPEIP